MEAKAWYYASGGLRIGPISLGQLKDLAASGQLQPSDLVWEAGRPGWMHAIEFAEVFRTGEGMSVPPPLPLSAAGGRELLSLTHAAGPKMVLPSNPPKDSVRMAVLSLLLVGLGQIVLGQKAKGVAMLLGAFVLGVLTGGLAAPFIWVFAAADAYKIGRRLKEGNAVGEWEWF